MDINLSILDIDNNRVGTEGGTKKINIVERKIDRPSFCSNSQKDKFMIDNRTGKLDAGRFPAQMFIQPDILEKDKILNKIDFTEEDQWIIL